MKIYEHMEAHLGQIARGWKAKDNDYGVQVSLFEQTPYEGLLTYCTLGLSSHPLEMEGGRVVRQELLFTAYPTYSPDAVSSFLMTFAESIASSGKALMRGEVIEGKPLIKNVHRCLCVYSCAME